jgi:glycyl-tRNA synthetase
MMFKTNIGASEAHSNIGYLRPETAQSIFVNFKNVLSTTRVKLPFGIAQIGKAFRNEITPKQFLFRMREFEQMEIEWFCEADDANQMFEFWRDKRLQFYAELGINKDKLRLHKHEKEELAHYSTQTDDIEYNFPFGWKELEGIAHRGNFDLTQHSQHSGKDLAVFNEQTKTSVIPDVVECSVGTDRLLLTILFDSYREDTIGGEARTYFAFKPSIAPIKAAFFPLSKKLEESARTVFNEIRKTIPNIQFDVSGSIGKRYRRQDEIGTPLCFTYDFDSEETQTITVRDRNSTEQERIAIDQILPYIQKTLAS